MAARQIVFGLLFSMLLPVTRAAQTSSTVAPSAVMVEQEPHHHLTLKNDAVKVLEVDLAPRDVMPMHLDETDEILVIIGDATTVSTTPGRADILWMSKNGQLLFTPGGVERSVRNIGQTDYRAVSIQLLRAQTGARNLCGKQIPNTPRDCPAASDDPMTASSDVPQDVPQFATDQVRVTLTTIRPRQQASFGEPNRDELIVAIDGAIIAPAGGIGSDQTLAAGTPLWIARGSVRRTFKNQDENDLRIVTVEFKP